MNILERLLFRLKTGADVKYLGSGTMTTIRFKDIFVDVWEGDDGNHSVSWSESPMNPTMTVREFWTAVPPKKGKS